MTKTKDSKTKTAAQEKTEKSSTQEQHETPSTQKTEKTKDKDESKAAGGSKKREFNEAELKRLREGLQKEAEKIHKPPPREFTPNTFNGLKPYFDMSTAVFVHELPTDVRHGYTNRALATGLCEPAVALRMDVEIPPKVPQQTSPRSRHDHQQKQKPKEDSDRPAAEGSTRLPQFPVVQFSSKKVQKKKDYYFNDVPTIRYEVYEQFSPRGSRKVEEDYKKTKADFYRMELDKMDDYSDFSRPHMRAAYFAYLQNTAGSSRAVQECVKKAEKPNSSEEKQSAETNEEKKQNENDERTKESTGKSGASNKDGDLTHKKEVKDKDEQKGKEKTKTREEQQQKTQASTTPQQSKQSSDKEVKHVEKKSAQKDDKTKKKTDKDDRDEQAQKSDAGKATVKKTK